MNGCSRVALGCVLGIVVAGCADEVQDWETAKRVRSVEAVQAFVEHFGDGENAEEARVLLELVQEEQNEWEAASETGTERALRHYIEQYPHSRFQSQARAALGEAVARLVKEFEPEFLVIIIESGIAIWHGPLIFSLGDEQGLRWGYTLVPPDPLKRKVAIAVLDDKGLVPSMRKGRAYIWRGGSDVIEWRDISAVGDENSVAEALGFDSAIAYATALPSELAE